MEDRPGIKTTEFWVTVAMIILSTLVATGVISDGEANELGELLTPLITAALPVVAYIWSRTKVKALEY